MQSNTTTAEAGTAKDSRIQELLEVVSLLKDSLSECLEYVKAEEFSNPSNKTSNILGRADEAIYQADEVLK
jgi:hypothetical protein